MIENREVVAHDWCPELLVREFQRRKAETKAKSKPTFGLCWCIAKHRPIDSVRSRFETRLDNQLACSNCFGLWNKLVRSSKLHESTTGICQKKNPDFQELSCFCSLVRKRVIDMH